LVVEPDSSAPVGRVNVVGNDKVVGMPVPIGKTPVAPSVLIVLTPSVAVLLAEVGTAVFADSVTAGDVLEDTVLSVMIVDRPMSVRPVEDAVVLGDPEDAAPLTSELGAVGTTSFVDWGEPVPADATVPTEVPTDDAEEVVEELVVEAVGATTTPGTPLLDAPEESAAEVDVEPEELLAVGETSLLGTGPPVLPRAGRNAGSVPWL